MHCACQLVTYKSKRVVRQVLLNAQEFWQCNTMHLGVKSGTVMKSEDICGTSSIFIACSTLASRGRHGKTGIACVGLPGSNGRTQILQTGTAICTPHWKLSMFEF